MNSTRNILTPVLVALLLLLISLRTASAYYDPGVQRWINRDPLGDQTRAQAFLSEPAGVKSNANPMPFDALEGPNPYAFVHNQPTIGYDADGLLAESPECLAARISANILRRLMRRLVYLEVVSKLVKELAEELVASKGVKLEEQYENAPVLGELYKRVSPRERSR